MKTNILFRSLISFLLISMLFACGGGGKEKATEETTKTDSTETKAENKEEKEVAKTPTEPTELGSYETKCDEQTAVSKLIFDGQEIDTKNLNKVYAMNFGGTSQMVYLANFEPDMKMLASGNIDNKKLQAGQILIKLIFSRRNNKTSKDLITTIAPYNRIIVSNPEEESQNGLLAYVHTQGKSYGNKFLGSGMLSAVTTKVVCGKIDMKGENDDKYQLVCTFYAENTLK